MIIKAIAGGGGRGVRIVGDLDQVESAFRQSAREALNAFGNDALYVEEFMSRARHIEVQIVGIVGERLNPLCLRPTESRSAALKILIALSEGIVKSKV